MELKLSRDEIVTGLASEVQPERDVINKDGEGFVTPLSSHSVSPTWSASTLYVVPKSIFVPFHLQFPSL
jgi:hypothetical protein